MHLSFLSLDEGTLLAEELHNNPLGLFSVPSVCTYIDDPVSGENLAIFKWWTPVLC